MTLSTSYAFGDVFGLRHSLHRSFRDAKQFYASYAALVVVAAAIVLIPGAPLGLITTSVQALAGVLLPSATVFLLLLCNDPEVLGPWVNPRWLNAVAGLILGALLVLSGVLVITTVFTHLHAGTVALWLAIGLAAGVLIAGAMAANRPGSPRPGPAPGPGSARGTQHLANAAAGPPQARDLVTGNQARHDRAPRLPPHLRPAPDRQGRPDRRRIGTVASGAAAGAGKARPGPGLQIGRSVQPGQAVTLPEERGSVALSTRSAEPRRGRLR